MPPLWLQVLAIVSLLVAFLSAFVILFDILTGHRQKMAIMNVVWPVTALYFGPLTIWAYWVMGRSRMQGEQGKREARHKGKGRSFWEITFVGATHCGAGCTLGDILGEWAVFFLGFTLAGIALWPEFIFDYILAYILGIIFQYFAIAPMRGLSLRKGLWEAIKADTLSLTAFEVGLFGWMALSSLVFFHSRLHPDSQMVCFSARLFVAQQELLFVPFLTL
jgi:hypothetical protein